MQLAETSPLIPDKEYLISDKEFLELFPNFPTNLNEFAKHLLSHGSSEHSRAINSLMELESKLCFHLSWISPKAFLKDYETWGKDLSSKGYSRAFIGAAFNGHSKHSTTLEINNEKKRGIIGHFEI